MCPTKEVVGFTYNLLGPTEDLSLIFCVCINLVLLSLSYTGISKTSRDDF